MDHARGPENGERDVHGNELAFCFVDREIHVFVQQEKILILFIHVPSQQYGAFM